MQTQYSTYRTLLAPVSGQGISEAEAKDILRQILPHLSKLHDYQKAHGSISLDTIAYDFKRMEVILLDSNGTNHPIYVAPEVSQPQQTTPSADVYALGVVIIVLLTGFPPQALKNSNGTWNWQELCNVSEQFRQILNVALFAEPVVRYSNAGQMLQYLQPVINLSQSTITSLANNSEPILLPTPSAQNLLSPSSLLVALSLKAHSVKTLNLKSSYIHKIKKIKRSFSNSQIYRKAQASKNLSKSTTKGITRTLVALFLGVGVIFSGAVGTYFYMQSQAADSTKKNLEFANDANQSRNKAIVSIYEEDTHRNDDPIQPIQKVENITKDERWQNAIDAVKGISQAPYWQWHGKEILEEAKQKLISPTVVPPTQSVSSPLLNTDPPRNSNPNPSTETSNPPIQVYNPHTEAYNSPTETYRPPKEAYSPPPERSNPPLPPAPRVAK